MLTRIITAGLVSGAIAVGSLGVQPTQAAYVDGWYTFSGSSTRTGTFNDRSPARTTIGLALQKKAGGRKCTARVVVRKGGYIWRSRIVYKYTRTRSRAYAGVIAWPNRAKRASITVRTNGRCHFRVIAR